MTIRVQPPGAISRRAVIISSAATMIPMMAPAGRAEQEGRVYRLGFVVQPPREDFAAMFDELGRLGFAEGKNLWVDPRGFAIPADRLVVAAAETVEAGPDVIYAGGVPAALAVQRVTRTIPLVATAYDMVKAQLVASLARPGGNTTGISILATELDGKRLEILIDLLPGIRRVAALVDPETAASAQVDQLISAARSRGVALSVHRAASTKHIASAIEAALADGAEALHVLSSAMFQTDRGSVIAQVAKLRLPTMYQWPEWARDGALICYGPPITTFYRQAARQIVKIFKGIKPADIPVEQPDKIELVINLKTAQALGLTVPQSLLARADEVIE